MAAYQYIYVMKGLSKTYPGGRQVLNDIWLSFLPGAKIGVLGLNGAGKAHAAEIIVARAAHRNPQRVRIAEQTVLRDGQAQRMSVC